MTRIGPVAAARTCNCEATKAMRRTRRGMCVACNGNRLRCPRSGAMVHLHIQGQPCPRGWHPDKRGRVRWLGLLWSGVPYPMRHYLAWRVGPVKRIARGGWLGFVRSFAGCGCIRPAKAAWLKLRRCLR